MRADRRHAVRIGTTQAEAHATAQIQRRPLRPISHRCEPRVMEGAVDIGTAFDRVALVEMRVDVDQGRPDLATAEIDLRDPVVAGAIRLLDPGNPALPDQYIGPHDAF